MKAVIVDFVVSSNDNSEIRYIQNHRRVQVFLRRQRDSLFAIGIVHLLGCTEIVDFGIEYLKVHEKEGYIFQSKEGDRETPTELLIKSYTIDDLRLGLTPFLFPVQ